jgi:hypothetical protein
LTPSSKIHDSIIGDNTISLAEFTFYTANKYWRGQFDEDMGFGITIRNVLLVHHVVFVSTDFVTDCSISALFRIAKHRAYQEGFPVHS